MKLTPYKWHDQQMRAYHDQEEKEFDIFNNKQAKIIDKLEKEEEAIHAKYAKLHDEAINKFFKMCDDLNLPYEEGQVRE